MTANKKSFIHRWVENEAHLGIRGALFLPIRAPDYNPVELLFSYVKGFIHAVARSAASVSSPSRRPPTSSTPPFFR